MKQTKLTIRYNYEVADRVWRMELTGDVEAITAPGQFINIALPGHFLRRPISVCDMAEDAVTILYKVVGGGTRLMTDLKQGVELDVLTGLGNGFDLGRSGKYPLVAGGGIGSAPLLYLVKRLCEQGACPTVVLGFNTASEVLLEEEFVRLTGRDRVRIATVDGSYGGKGFVTDAMKGLNYSYFYACGPMPMLKALYRCTAGNGTGDYGYGDGEFSLEERMGCGFGACVGCSIQTEGGVKRICKDGPVFRREELKWGD